MARKSNATAANSFTAASYNVALAALIKAGNSIDKATGDAKSAVSTWAIATAIGLKSKALTIDSVKEAVIAATPLARRKANAEAFAASNPGKTIGTDSLASCGAAVKGWVYSIARIEAAGSLDRIIKGESLSAVRSDSKPKQQQSKGKRATSAVNDDTTANDTKAIPVPVAAIGELADAINAVTARLASVKVSTLRNSTNQRALAALAAQVAKCAAMVEAAERAAKAAPKAKAATRKAA